MFRKKTHGQVIGTELQEGFAHIGTAATEAGRLAAEHLGPRMAAAQKAAAPKLEAAQKAMAPAVASAREAVGPRVEAVQKAAAPKVAAAMAAAQKAAADLAPRVESAWEASAPRIEAAQKAAQKTLRDDVVPRVTAAREAVAPALESARGTLLAGVDSARHELAARQAELVASAEKSTRKARKAAKKARKAAGKKRHEFDKKAAATATHVKRKVGIEPEPRRWPWVLLVLGVVGAAVVALKRKSQDDWTPAPSSSEPVPSYREDPVPSTPTTPSESGKAVSTAMGAAGDSSPSESDLGARDAQMADGDGADEASKSLTDAPEPFTSGGGAQGTTPTAGPDDKKV